MEQSLSLLTDLYQLTMAYGYWRSGMDRQHACFHLFFREHPFNGGFTIAAGLETAIDYLAQLRFSDDEIGYLRSLAGSDGAPLFPDDFLAMLRAFALTCDVDAVPEGTVVFPQQPLVRVRGPILEAQLVESALLNIINFQSLIATKAARLVLASRGEPVLDFGLRRAQGVDGALTAARAAFIGGCAGTSNVLAGERYGIPVRGTHAHSWVMSFPSEREAFEAYAAAMPNNVLLLVDTYDTLQGVRNAIDVARALRERGGRFGGIRLDSGDLAYLSIEARRMLDEAGFEDAVIAASNDLDEYLIANLKEQGARINLWGVGTRLVTAYDQPALGGVYKLGALRDRAGAWQHKIKLSEQVVKISNPGVLQVRRFVEEGLAAGDMIFDELTGSGATMVDPLDATRRKTFAGEGRDLLVPVFRNGQPVYDRPSLEAIRAHRESQLALFHGGIKRFLNPHVYPVGLEAKLFDLKTRLIVAARGTRAA